MKCNKNSHRSSNLHLAPRNLGFYDITKVKTEPRHFYESLNVLLKLVRMFSCVAKIDNVYEDIC